MKRHIETDSPLARAFRASRRYHEETPLANMAARRPASLALAEARRRLAAVDKAEADYLAANPETGDAAAPGAYPIDSAAGHTARARLAHAKGHAGQYHTGPDAWRIWPAATMSEDGTAIYLTRPDGFGAVRDIRKAEDIMPRLPCAYYDNPRGESARDGSGLIWGVVALLSHGRALAGWQQGGVDAGPTLSTRIFTGEDAAEDAARYADGLAERAAEAERDYQQAWDAGARWAQLGEDIGEARAAALRLLAERRELRATRASCEAWPSMARAIRDSVAGWVRDIAEAREERAALESDYGACEGWADGAQG